MVRFLIILTLINVLRLRALSVIQTVQQCPCNSLDLCTINHRAYKREVTIVTENKSDFKKWKWEGIHNVINAAPTDDKKLIGDNNLMCYTHSMKANYGILATMPSNDTMTRSDLDKWMKNIVQRAKDTYAEFIAVDLLDIVGNCYMSPQNGERVINLTKGFADQVHLSGRKLTCILPWKPPCFQGECTVMAELDKQCDAVITSPDSFVTECDKHCRAKATMPMSNLIIGTDEYLYKEQISASKFYIGIPWHGYDYKCKNYMGTDDPVCEIPTKPNSTHCDFESARKKMTFFDLDTQYPENFKNKHNWSKLYNANYFDVNKTDNGDTGVHEIWYESDQSLYEKYKFALDMNLRGVVIWTVDDLVNFDKGDAIEWNWLMHNMMLTGEAPETDMSMALKAMAIGVGCFIGGCVIGAIITTLIAKRQMKYFSRQYKPPFQKDEEEDEAANFHEDDKYL